MDQKLSLNCIAIFLSFLIPALTLLQIIWKIRKASSSGSTLPPGPPKLPLIGNLHQLVCLNPHHRLMDLAKTYGPLMQLQLGQVSAIVVSSPDAAQQVLKNFELNFIERGREYVTNILFYERKDIVFAPFGDHWRQMRKICNVHLLSSTRVQSFRLIREEEVSYCIRFIHSKVGSPINFSEMVFSLMNSTIARATMGRKSNNQQVFIQLLEQLLKALDGFSLVDVFPSLKFINVISGLKSRLEKLHREIDVILEDIINEHRDRSGFTKGGETQLQTLLDVLLKLQEDQDSPLTTDIIKAIILDIFIGGTHATATVVEWAMSELIKNPRILRKAQEEVRKVHIETGKIDEKILHRFQFVKAIIKETLRLHPPTPLIPRRSIEECDIYGHNIKSKTDILINIWAIGRDPSYWTEPERFYPERFLDSQVDYKGLNFEYIPFGAGRRICAGMMFGIANVELALAQFLCLCNWELPGKAKPKDLDMTEAFAIAVRRKNDLYLIATPYHHAMEME